MPNVNNGKYDIYPRIINATERKIHEPQNRDLYEFQVIMECKNSISAIINIINRNKSPPFIEEIIIPLDAISTFEEFVNKIIQTLLNRDITHSTAAALDSDMGKLLSLPPHVPISTLEAILLTYDYNSANVITVDGTMRKHIKFEFVKPHFAQLSNDYCGGNNVASIVFNLSIWSDKTVWNNQDLR